MILVIMGAGASYDSVPSRRPSEWPRERLPERPPLAQELFADLPLVTSVLKKFPECFALIPHLRVHPATATIENTLETFQTEADTDVVRQRQLAAIRFYLQHVIWDFEKEWLRIHNGITNHRALLDQLRRSRHPDEPVCIVTFNYDRLIERALEHEGVVIKSINDYIANPTFKLFKLHGSVDWAKPVVAPFDSVNKMRDETELIRELISNAEHVRLSSDFRIINKQPAAMLDTVPIFPAIAIPVEKKTEFVCPTDHLEYLKELLSDTSRILIIGWRGAEEHFNHFMWECMTNRSPKSNFPPTPKVCAVADTATAAKAVLNRSLLDRLSLPISAYGDGFTGFIEKRNAEKFCKE